jgi:hypothetical protein
MRRRSSHAAGAFRSRLPLLACLLLWGCGERGYETVADADFGELPQRPGKPDPTWPESVPEGPIDFKEHVRPLLIINCMECHNREDAKHNGNYILETRTLAMTTGTAPPAIVPGDPDASPLLTVLSLDPMHQRAMPPAPDKIWGVRLEILRRWIAEGAVWPEDVVLVHPREITEW